jgi:hypothetical protein
MLLAMPMIVAVTMLKTVLLALLLAVLTTVLLAAQLTVILAILLTVLLAVLVNIPTENFSSCPQSMLGNNCLLEHLHSPFMIYIPTHSTLYNLSGTNTKNEPHE